MNKIDSKTEMQQNKCNKNNITFITHFLIFFASLKTPIKQVIII